MKNLSIFIVLLFAISSFATRLTPISEEELQSRVEFLTQAPYKGGATLKYTGEEAGCAIFNLTYPVKDPYSETILKYEMKFSWPHVNEPVPVIFSVPTIEGVTLMEKSVLKQMCHMKVAAVLAHVNNEGLDLTQDGILLADHQLMRGAVALRSLIDVLEDPPAVEGSSSISHVMVDTKRLGIVGLSVGSVSSLIAAAVDERIKAIFIMGAVGNTPHALAFSTHEKVVGFRNAQMKNLKMKEFEKFEMHLRSHMQARPLDFSPLLAKRNVYQVIVQNDSVAPTDGQLEIKDRTGNKNTYIDRGLFGHGVAIAGEIMVNQHHLPNFVQTLILK